MALRSCEHNMTAEVDNMTRQTDNTSHQWQMQLSSVATLSFVPIICQQQRYFHLFPAYIRQIAAEACPSARCQECTQQGHGFWDLHMGFRQEMQHPQGRDTASVSEHQTCCGFPISSSGRVFFSRVNFLCWALIWVSVPAPCYCSSTLKTPVILPKSAG